MQYCPVLIHFKYDFDTSDAAAKDGACFIEAAKKAKQQRLIFRIFVAVFVCVKP